MVGHYAIKSIVVIDFIDLRDIAIALPSAYSLQSPIKTRCLGICERFQEFPNSEDVHGIAVTVGNFAASCGIKLCADVKNLQGNIIGPSALPSEFHQGDATLCRTMTADSRLQLFVAYDAPKTVRAKQEIIAILQCPALPCHVHGQIPSRP
jgi:hypothetical protein